jgi:phosphatidylserine/phosphatidylglycerophosphate/cardiolipin synthase-like enzyme/uncharacterized membrane protein YdjX (TVP38/TMEM64 family)
MTTATSRLSLFRPGDNCCAVANADRAAMIVDAAAYFEAFKRAAERAERSILILAWDFDSRTLLSAGRDPGGSTSLGEFLNTLVRKRRRLHVRVLDWDYPMIYGTDREFPPLFGLGWKPHRRVHLRYDGVCPLAGSQHQKIAVIDDNLAFVGGLDLTTRRWDTPDHLPQDPRRVANGKPYPPFHDVMAAVDGQAAAVLAGIARKRWQKATGERLSAAPSATDPWPDSLEPDLRDVGVAVACTEPPDDAQPGVRHVEQLYLDMIARARRYIYIENQYFTARTLGDAMAARLAERDGPEIVVVTRLLSHGWLEEVTMHTLRTRLIRDLREADRHNRFRVYYPHVEGLLQGTCIDIHSKAMIVDDEWLRIGSANVSNRSMGVDTECDVAIEGHRPSSTSDAIRNCRDRLLAEHLNVAPADVSRAIEREGGLSAAIAALRSSGRTLKELEELPETSDALVEAVAISDPERPVSLESLVEQFAPQVEVRKMVAIWKKTLAAAILLLALALMWRFTPVAEVVTAENASVWASGLAGRWWAGPLLVFAYTPASLVMFPRPLITLAAVFAFGPWIGFVCAVSGNLIAAEGAYLAGRRLSRDTVRSIAGDKLNRLSHALRKGGWLAVSAIRLFPVAPFIVGSVVAGAIRVKNWHFLLGTFFGMLPGVLAATVFGAQLQAVLRDEAELNYGLIGAVVLLLAAGAAALRRWFAKMDTTGMRSLGAASKQEQ